MTSDVNWQRIGHAIDVRAMAAVNGKLFAATGDDRLWARDPVLKNVNWELVGHANDVTAMTAISGKLFGQPSVGARPRAQRGELAAHRLRPRTSWR